MIHWMGISGDAAERIAEMAMQGNRYLLLVICYWVSQRSDLLIYQRITNNQ